MAGKVAIGLQCFSRGAYSHERFMADVVIDVGYIDKVWHL